MTSVDWNERQLCDDGACTGVIGRDGRCSACGRVAQFWGDERRRGLREPSASETAGAVPAAEGELAERRLCPDGNCTGIIGPDGRCKVCGRLDEGAPVGAVARGEDEHDDAGEGEEGDDTDDEDEDVDEGEDADDGRRLCADGSCTGLIGPGGTCKLCGKVEEL